MRCNKHNGQPFSVMEIGGHCPWCLLEKERKERAQILAMLAALIIQESPDGDMEVFVDRENFETLAPSFDFQYKDGEEGVLLKVEKTKKQKSRIWRPGQ